jgi:hypothetical protein
VNGLDFSSVMRISPNRADVCDRSCWQQGIVAITLSEFSRRRRCCARVLWATELVEQVRNEPKSVDLKKLADEAENLPKYLLFSRHVPHGRSLTFLETGRTNVGTTRTGRSEL